MEKKQRHVIQMTLVEFLTKFNAGYNPDTWTVNNVELTNNGANVRVVLEEKAFGPI